MCNSLTLLQLLEQDKPVRDGEWTSPEIELINEKVCPGFSNPQDTMLIVSSYAS
jgi:hypothetical protein